MEKAKVALLAVIAMLLAGILFTLATQEPEVITETVTEEPQAWSEDSLEQCAFCGAHVIEVWHAKDANGNFVHVCSKCADEYYAEKQ